jgi:DNA-directed RNA polymerase specialized sigma24 family protein
MPLPDVAASLGIPLGTAKSRLHRSIDLLRRQVGGDVETTRPPVGEGRLA